MYTTHISSSSSSHPPKAVSWYGARYKHHLLIHPVNASLLDISAADISVVAAAVDGGKHSILVTEKLGSAGTILLAYEHL